MTYSCLVREKGAIDVYQDVSERYHCQMSRKLCDVVYLRLLALKCIAISFSTETHISVPLFVEATLYSRAIEHDKTTDQGGLNTIVSLQSEPHHHWRYSDL